MNKKGKVLYALLAKEILKNPLLWSCYSRGGDTIFHLQRNGRDTLRCRSGFFRWMGSVEYRGSVVPLSASAFFTLYKIVENAYIDEVKKRKREKEKQTFSTLISSLAENQGLQEKKIDLLLSDLFKENEHD